MKKGFTLVEVLVSLGIMALLVASLFAVLEIGDAAGREDAGSVDLQQQVRLAMDGMIREIRQSKASDITISDPGTAAGSVITFKVQNSAYCYRYALVSGQIIRSILDCLTGQVLAQGPVVNEIDSLGFSILGNLVQIDLSAAKIIKNRRICFPSPCTEPDSLFSQKVRLRN